MDKKLIGLMTIFFLFFAIFAIIAISPSTLSRFTQAQVETIPSAEATRVLAWPLYDLKADGTSASTVTVIVRNSKTIPIEGRTVSVSTSLGLFRESTTVTDKQGMAVFHLTSTTPGTALIEVTVDNEIKVPQSVSVQFAQ